MTGTRPDRGPSPILLLGVLDGPRQALAQALQAVLPEGDIRASAQLPHPVPTGPKGTSARVLLLGLPTHANDDEAAADAQLRAALQAAGLTYVVVYGQGATGLDQALLALGHAPVQAGLQAAREAVQYALDGGRMPWRCERCSDPECEHRLFRGLPGLGG